MARYLINRTLALVPVLLGVSIITFALLNIIPGDPTTTMLGAFASEHAREDLRQSLGLDKPLPVQYLFWLWKMLHFDFGVSYVRSQPVFPLAMSAFENTLVLFPVTVLVFLFIGLVVGAISASYRGTSVDRMAMLAALVGTSMPVYWLGLMFILIFSLKLGWFPSGGMRGFFGNSGWVDVLQHAVLPAIVAAAVPGGTLARVVATALLETMKQDFVWVLRAAGIPERTILAKHVFRNALPTILSMIGLQIGYLLGGQVFAEVVFNWPGIGQLIFDAILKRDLPLIQASVLIVSFCFVATNAIVDVLYGAADPRISRA
jgi:peptide/nickel transport system permease protein